MVHMVDIIRHDGAFGWSMDLRGHSGRAGLLFTQLFGGNLLFFRKSLRYTNQRSMDWLFINLMVVTLFPFLFLKAVAHLIIFPKVGKPVKDIIHWTVRFHQIRVSKSSNSRNFPLTSLYCSTTSHYAIVQAKLDT
jgi:hypothetical protein